MSRGRQLFGHRPVCMKEVDDNQIVRQCLGGDKEAFSRLVEKYQGIVYNVALRMVKDAGDAEDIAQAALVKAYEKLRSYNERYRFYSWLYRITINEALNHLDRQRRFSALDDGTEDPQQNPELASEARDRSERIQEALMELNVDQRAVLVLRHFEERSYEEIGFILEIPVKRVKSRLFDARQILRDVLVRKGMADA
jgi:RNA polymerase sigma-70 factor, ECF subfamily